MYVLPWLSVRPPTCLISPVSKLPCLKLSVNGMESLASVLGLKVPRPTDPPSPSKNIHYLLILK